MMLFGKRKEANRDKTNQENADKQKNNKNKSRITEFRLKPEDNVDILVNIWQKSKNDLAKKNYKASSTKFGITDANGTSGTGQNSTSRY
uniref:Uncharacterized protein n=1 Tax=Romanomermis culicivorax TaxID=13658 RepID=A0A915JGY9_ROMCU